MDETTSHRRTVPPRRPAGARYLHADGVLRDHPEAAAAPSPAAPSAGPGAAATVDEEGEE